jgi:hypothetical protein
LVVIGDFRERLAMALSFEFTEFVRNWERKANEYDTSDLGNCFDKFFTLYVAFNRIYAEATFTLARNGKIQLNNDRPFPDKKAATAYFL